MSAQPIDVAQMLHIPRYTLIYVLIWECSTSNKALLISKSADSWQNEDPLASITKKQSAFDINPEALTYTKAATIFSLQLQQTTEGRYQYGVGFTTWGRCDS